MATQKNASKRIIKEMCLVNNTSQYILAAAPVDPSDLLKWTAFIKGPVDSVYENGIFELSIIFPSNYPFVPPKIEFLTSIYHCNIVGSNICVDILKSQWSPALTIDKVLLSISSLLSDPNPDDPLTTEVATKYKHDRKEHDRIAREWTEKYAGMTQDVKNKLRKMTAARKVINGSEKTEL